MHSMGRYVDGGQSKWHSTWVIVSSLIFNRFVMRIIFRDDCDSDGFSTMSINCYICPGTVDTRQGSLMHSMKTMSTLSIQNTSTHFYPLLWENSDERFSILMKFWKAETQGSSTIPSMALYVNSVNTRHGSLIPIARLSGCDTVDTVFICA